ncbi:hypothetical protein [Rhizobium paknamense]|uniref:Uncharacterized protein n=1 Tax=Rhizobium paknamense TaxID=1206817 RepID=A0ABU0IIK4_9HYPH|nr:hypothetical protein [Rhizobium paknamense]MDQ0457250.1 hypothetical protein [Rhizobium paknamense]
MTNVIEIRKSRKSQEREDMPPAGPHARPELTDKEKTPGTGALPEDSQEDVTPGSG